MKRETDRERQRERQRDRDREIERQRDREKEKVTTADAVSALVFNDNVSKESPSPFFKLRPGTNTSRILAAFYGRRGQRSPFDCMWINRCLQCLGLTVLFFGVATPLRTFRDLP